MNRLFHTASIVNRAHAMMKFIGQLVDNPNPQHNPIFLSCWPTVLIRFGRLIILKAMDNFRYWRQFDGRYVPGSVQ